jgi:3-oxoacyl-[acyl-carrier-protein] synthase-3
MMAPLKIVGTGAYRPVARALSSDIDVRLEKEKGWIEVNFRIRERGVANAEETSSSMGASAAKDALVAAGLTADSLDVIVGACGVMEQPIPGTAPLIQQKLGLGGSGIPAFDINATCLSFLAALDVVAMGMAADKWSRALIVSADIASAALNFEDPKASVIFGDGAAAMVVESVAPDEGPALLECLIETYGDGAKLCELQAGGTRLRPHEDLDGFLAASLFRMDGPGLYRAARKRAPRLIHRLLDGAGVGIDDINLVIPHQASAQGLDFLRDVMGLGSERVVDIFADHGNQIAASMPTALHVAIASGRLKRGDLAMLIGTAAGISLGAAVLRY